MARRAFTPEEMAVLRRIVTGGHPSPGSEYLGWPQSDWWLTEVRLKLALADERVEMEHDRAELRELMPRTSWRMKR